MKMAMSQIKECSMIIDSKIQGTDICVGSEEWKFYLEHTNEVFEYWYEGLKIHCCRNTENYWIAFLKGAKHRFGLGQADDITVERMEIVGQKILDKLTAPDNAKN